MNRRIATLGALLLPLLAYPVCLAFLFAADVMVGGRDLPYLLVEERRLLLETVVGDFIASLPMAFVGVLALAGVFLGLRTTGVIRGTGWLLAMGGLAGWGLGGFLSGRWLGSSALALALGVATIGAMLAVLLRPLLTPEPR